MELVIGNHVNANAIKDYFIPQVMFENSLKNCTHEPLGGGNLKEFSKITCCLNPHHYSLSFKRLLFSYTSERTRKVHTFSCNAVQI